MPAMYTHFLPCNQPCSVAWQLRMMYSIRPGQSRAHQHICNLLPLITFTLIMTPT